MKPPGGPWILILALGSFFSMAVEARTAQIEGLQPWCSKSDPEDEARRHVENIETGTHTYIVVQGGTMDGENCRTPHGSWIPFVQTWESNRAVRMENTGTEDVVNPWLSNGRNNLRSISEIVSEALTSNMTDREKAIALWMHQMRYCFHAWTGDGETADPAKLFNVYGYTTCGHSAPVLAGMWKRAGLKISPALAIGHVLPQVFYDSAWHVLDADMKTIYLERDNHTIASEQEIARDHDLVKRTHAEGLLLPDGRAGNEWEASLFVHEGKPYGDYDCRPDHTMDMKLRPGEAITWRWGQLDPPKYHGTLDIKLWGQEAADTICNGLWEYHPDLTDQVWRNGADSIDNVHLSPEGLVSESNRPGSIIWTIRSPYVFVGGKLHVEGLRTRFYLSFEGESWDEVENDLDHCFPQGGPARYEYRLKCELSGGALLRSLHITNDLQMAPLALPGISVGENALVYTDESKGEHKVRITHEWIERSLSEPPNKPALPIFPPVEGEIEGTEIVFEWGKSTDPDGDRIGDYHFELSEFADMRWPLSSNFSKLISLTADRGKEQYTLPYVGMLEPDRKYYWHVRAKDQKGVWGPWSETWCFVARAPAPPEAVVMDFDPQQGIGKLRWRASQAGRRPVKYRVYGSNEKGFSVNDEEYPVMDLYAGDWRDASLDGRFSGNFVSETTETEMVVVKEGLSLPNTNRAFYRVVAVDNQGNRSWSSDYASAPRPFVYTTPRLKAVVGREYQYRLGTIRSLGDLSLRNVRKEQVPEFWPPEKIEAALEGPEWLRQVTNFWDVQKPRFILRASPSWLTIDEVTGILKGTPNQPGTHRVIVAVTLGREVEELDLEALVWGRRQVTGKTIERMGPVTQEFVLEISE